MWGNENGEQITALARFKSLIAYGNLLTATFVTSIPEYMHYGKSVIRSKLGNFFGLDQVLAEQIEGLALFRTTRKMD